MVRDLFDLNGGVDQRSTAYEAGLITGTVWGFIPIGLEEVALLADRTVLNSNRYFRIGPGGFGKDMVPRISSPYLPGDGHLPLSPNIPAIPPVGACEFPLKVSTSFLEDVIIDFRLRGPLMACFQALQTIRLNRMPVWGNDIAIQASQFAFNVS